jgi:uncharacterized protein (DUF1499 family)
MIHSYLVWSTVALTLSQSLAFSPRSQLTERNVVQLATPRQEGNTVAVTRKEWVSQVVATVSAAFVGVNSNNDAANAAEEEEPQSYSIEKCSTSSKSPCVSTANVKQLDLYLPPWTFEGPVNEVMSRLKGAIVTDTTCQIVKQDGNRYLKAEAKRSDLFGTIDELEFIINEKDQVVTFRSMANDENNDFAGINKKRLEAIRKRAGIFGVMGEYLNTADSVSIDERGNGPMGQLKAFYGLQSGAGFEDVLLE